MVKSGSLVISALLLGAASAQAQIYRWVDDDGNVHFTDTPPVAKQVTEVDVRVPAPVAPAVRAGADQEALLAMAAPRTSQAPAARESAPAGADIEGTAAEADACRQARVDYYWLSQQMAIYVDDQGDYRARYRGDPYQGERTWLNDNQRKEAVTATNRRLGEFCADPLDKAALEQAAYEVQLAEACTIARAKLDAMLREQSRTAEEQIDEQALIVGRVCNPPA